MCSIFAIDGAAFGIMLNHFHAVLHVDVEKAQRWSDDQELGHALRKHQISRKQLTWDRKTGQRETGHALPYTHAQIIEQDSTTLQCQGIPI